MRIAVIGTGYVGLVSAASFAELGHSVIGVDIDEAKIRMLKEGKSPIYEPGLQELIGRGMKSGLLSFTTDVREALPHVQIMFSAVATPHGENHTADLRTVFTVADAVADSIDHDILFVNKSTVPVGTGRQCEERIAKKIRDRGVQISVPVVSNPEFLREGMAVTDTLMPDRIVVGINTSTRNEERGTRNAEHAKELMQELYRPITRVGKPLLFMGRESAEIVKYACNAFLATKISFINMLTEFAEKTGANIRDIAAGMGLDDRIGPRFLHAGIGYGGSCFPKDVKALLAMAREYDLDFGIVEATDRINTHQRQRFFEKILSVLKQRTQGSLPAEAEPFAPKGGATVGIWGLSFKPKTDDMREAQSLDLLPVLLEHGHAVQAFDPFAMENARKLLPPGIRFAASPMGAAKDADAVVLLTEWDIFRGIDLSELRNTMKGNDLFDGRNAYEPKAVQEAGLVYHGIGL